MKPSAALRTSKRKPAYPGVPQIPAWADQQIRRGGDNNFTDEQQQVIEASIASACEMLRRRQLERMAG